MSYGRIFLLKLIKQIKLINLIKKLKKIRPLEASIFFNSKRRESPIYQNEKSIYQNDKGLSPNGKEKRAKSGQLRPALLAGRGRVSNAENESAAYHP